MVRSNEPLWWAPFFAGAGVAALLMPITIVTTMLAGLGVIGQKRLWDMLHNPWVGIFLFILISLSLFHAVHRFRFILIDLGLKVARSMVAVVCYSLAIVGTLAAALLLLWLHF